MQGWHGILTSYKDCGIDSRHSQTLNIARDQIIDPHTRRSDGTRVSTGEIPVGDSAAITTSYENCQVDSRYNTTTNIAGNQIIYGAGETWQPRKLKATKLR